jgi:hypothetical protein
MFVVLGSRDAGVFSVEEERDVYKFGKINKNVDCVTRRWKIQEGVKKLVRK